MNLGLSLREVARKARFSAGYVSDLELGRRAWTLEAQRRIGRAMFGPIGAAQKLLREHRRTRP